MLLYIFLSFDDNQYYHEQEKYYKNRGCGRSIVREYKHIIRKCETDKMKNVKAYEYC